MSEWIEWNGGDFLPVPPEMQVRVLLRDGSIEGPAHAREFCGDESCWKHRGTLGDIVAYSSDLLLCQTTEKPIAHLVWFQGRRAIDDVEDYYEVARPGDKSVDGSPPFPVFLKPHVVTERMIEDGARAVALRWGRSTVWEEDVAVARSVLEAAYRPSKAPDTHKVNG